MREIKFRQPIYFNDKLLEFHYWGFFKNDNNFISPQCNNQDAFKNSNQFTGLQDKNGIEIYEGDILDKKYKWVVKYSKDSFKCYSEIEQSGKNPLLNHLIFSRNMAKIPIEVIGNIYENPELLKRRRRMNIKHLIGNPETESIKSICSKHQTYNADCELCNTTLETPITPESLKVIGFINSINEPLIYKSLNDQADLVYNCKRKIFYIDAYEAGDFAKVDVYFTSTEQIQQFIKHFQEGK